MAVVLAAGAGFLGQQRISAGLTENARAEAVAAAEEATVVLLSYKPETVDQDLASAEALMTGDFKESFAQLARDVVGPGARQHQISSAAQVPAASAVSVTRDRAVVLAFVNQSVTVGEKQPSESSSSVRIALDKIGDRWLISDFKPV
ncbi:hypothetical protein [Mycolicibacterium sp. XJ1819]